MYMAFDLYVLYMIRGLMRETVMVKNHEDLVIMKMLRTPR